MDPREKRRLLDELWTTIALLESKDEIRGFFKDLLSETEAVMLARRIKIAKLLLSGASYDWISEKLGTGYSTIASVHQWLQGGFGGYTNAIPKLEEELYRQVRVAERRQEASVPFSREWMRKKYPLHYLLVNMLRGEKDLPPKKLRKNS